MHIWQWIFVIYGLGLPVAFCIFSYHTGRKDSWRNEYGDNLSMAYFWPVIALYWSLSWISPATEQVYFYFRNKGIKHRDLAKKRRETSGAEQQGGRPAKNGRNRPF